jgi:flavin reductase (DIM6/NTAB) family NADH-FMN oxidoreductase RutF
MTVLSPVDPAPADRSTERPEAVAPTGDALRAILRAVASPVVVVTVDVDGGTRGATIGSFASVSLSPPLVSFNVTHGTNLHDALDAAEAFTVHLLAADQAALASHFARPDLDAAGQMAGVASENLPDGPLRLAGTLGTLACTVAARVAAGDHTVVIGEVTELVSGRDAAPLLYYRQSYRGIGSEVG